MIKKSFFDERKSRKVDIKFTKDSRFFFNNSHDDDGGRLTKPCIKCEINEKKIVELENMINEEIKINKNIINKFSIIEEENNKLKSINQILNDEKNSMQNTIKVLEMKVNFNSNFEQVINKQNNEIIKYKFEIRELDNDIADLKDSIEKKENLLENYHEIKLYKEKFEKEATKLKNEKLMKEQVWFNPEISISERLNFEGTSASNANHSLKKETIHIDTVNIFNQELNNIIRSYVEEIDKTKFECVKSIEKKDEEIALLRKSIKMKEKSIKYMNDSFIQNNKLLQRNHFIVKWFAILMLIVCVLYLIFSSSIK